MSSDKSEFFNFSHVPAQVRNSLKDLVLGWSEKEKNFKRLNAMVAGECSSRCLSNFKSDKLNSEENICLTNCFTKFYDVLELGEGVYDKLSTGKVDLTPFTQGKIEDISSKL